MGFLLSMALGKDLFLQKNKQEEEKNCLNLQILRTFVCVCQKYLLPNVL